MDVIALIIGLVVGLGVGGAACWLIRSARAGSEPAASQAAHQMELANLRLQHEQQLSAHREESPNLRLQHEQQLAEKQEELANVSLQHEQQLSAHREESANLRLQHEQQLAEKQEELANLSLQHEQQLSAQREELGNLRVQHEQQLAEKQEELANLSVQHEQQLSVHSAETARLKGELEQVATAQQMLETAKAQLGEQFKSTATDVLQSSNKQFMELSEQNLGKTMEQAKSELEQRHRQFQELVKPLSENYGKLNPQIDRLIQESYRITAETNKLSTALTGSRQAGHWGEVQLRKVVESAGMASYCDFHEQGTPSGSQQVRPDLVVNLPEKRAIVIDAKASTLAYMEAQQAEDEESASSAWTRHAQAMRRQVDDLANKNYGEVVQGSLDFVVMFVPGDQFLAAALGSNPGLVEYAMSKRVAIATPASLIAMLWAVSNGWQQFRLADNAARIKEVGEEMHKRMMTFVSHYSNVGKQLESAVTAYNSSVGSFDRRIAPQGRRFAQLVVGDEADFDTPAQVDSLPRRSEYSVGDEDGRIVAADN